MSSGRSKLYLNNLTNKANPTQEWIGQRIFVGKFLLRKKHIVIHRFCDVTFNMKRYGSRRNDMYNTHWCGQVPRNDNITLYVTYKEIIVHVHYCA